MRFLRMSRIKRWMTTIKVSCQVRTRRPRHVPSFRFWMPDLKVMKIKGTCPRKDLNPSSHPRSYRLSNSARSQPRPGVLRNHLAPHWRTTWEISSTDRRIPISLTEAENWSWVNTKGIRAGLLFCYNTTGHACNFTTHTIPNLLPFFRSLIAWPYKRPRLGCPATVYMPPVSMATFSVSPPAKLRRPV